VSVSPFDVVKTISDIVKALLEIFKPLKPETRKITIQYRTCKSRIELVIETPDGLCRKLRKIEIPAWKGFRVVEMRDETFHEIEALWKKHGEKWVLPISSLPASRRFLIILEGSVPRDFIKRIVRVQPALNRDQTEELDRYWLNCMLRDVTILERLWEDLEVEDVDVGVRVSIDRCFATALPKEVKEALEATQELLAAARGRDRGKLMKAWQKYRMYTHKIPSIEELNLFVQKVTASDFFRDYVTVDHPFRIGEIRRGEVGVIIPEIMFVEALTDLNLQNPAAIGYLTFKKKLYAEAIKDELGL